jgi:putative membrane protein
MPYSKIDPEKMILRDHLAYDRTVLANERTVLAYMRTAIAFAAAGGTLVKFFQDTPGLLITGVALLVLSLLVGILGVRRYFAVRSSLRTVYAPLDKDRQEELKNKIQSDAHDSE